MRALVIGTVWLSVFLPATAVAAYQAALNVDTDTAVCTFEDGKQVTARYAPVALGHNDSVPIGKPLMPGGSAMTFFTETDIIVGSTAIPPGGYTMYVIPGKKEWTLIISKNVKVDAKYDDKQDLARATMETGQLSTPADKLAVYFGHTGPKKCEVDVDYGKIRGWVEFKQK
jgi:Protein of unknown function (DUF2911)